VDFYIILWIGWKKAMEHKIAKNIEGVILFIIHETTPRIRNPVHKPEGIDSQKNWMEDVKSSVKQEIADC